jgi:hypothetical protein
MMQQKYFINLKIFFTEIIYILCIIILDMLFII